VDATARAQLHRRQRGTSCSSLRDGNPPLPVGAEQCRGHYQAFQKKARTNFADLIVEAMLDRMALRRAHRR
jgi:hypothetical protein